LKLNLFNIKLKLRLWLDENIDFILQCIKYFFFIFLIYYYNYDQCFNNFWDSLPIHIEYTHNFIFNGGVASFSFDMYFSKSIPKEVFIEIDLDRFKLSIEINNIE